MNQSLTEIFSKVIALVGAHGAVSASRHLMNPTRDWYIALLVWVVVTAGAASVSVYMFFLVGESDAGIPSVENETLGVDRSLLRETLTFFEGEAAEFESLRTNSPSVPPAF